MLVYFYRFFETLKNSPARRNRFIMITIALSVLINIGLWFFLFFELKSIVAQNPEFTTIPLHYNVFFGIDSVGKWYKAFILPLSGAVIIIINTVISFLVYSKKSLLSYFFSATTLLTQIFLSIASLLIILINL